MDGTSTYSVYGPYEIPVENRRGGRLIRGLGGFWGGVPCREGYGCYVFGMRAGRGIRPLYVGKATRKFESECFTAHKVNKYNEALAGYKKGRPVIFFLVQPADKGPVNKKEIENIENFLIQLGVAKSGNRLLNIRGRKQPKWSISHVIRGQKGRPSADEQQFVRMMGIS